MNYCKNCKYRNEDHLLWGGILEDEKCGKTVTVTAPETFYSRQEQIQLSIGRKDKLNADGKCSHYEPRCGWSLRLFCLRIENIYLKTYLAILKRLLGR